MAILLAPSEDEDGQWRRVGMMKMKDDIALKMRYKAIRVDKSDSEGKDDGKTKTTQPADEGNVNDTSEVRTTEVQQPSEENSGIAIDTKPGDVPGKVAREITSETRTPRTEPSLSEANKTTSYTTDLPSEPVSESTPRTQTEPVTVTQTQTQTQTNQSRSSPKPVYDPWPDLTWLTRQERFDVCQAQRTARKALKE